MQAITSLFALDKGIITFIILSGFIGGGIAYISGRAIALTWRPRWQLFFYMMLLAFVLRFFHWSLFHDPLLPWIKPLAEPLKIYADQLLSTSGEGSFLTRILGWIKYLADFLILYIIDFATLVTAALFGYQFSRANQMMTHYYWIK